MMASGSDNRHFNSNRTGQAFLNLRDEAMKIELFETSSGIQIQAGKQLSPLNITNANYNMSVDIAPSQNGRD